MKTKHLNFVCVLLLFLFSNNLFSQDSMFKLIADATENTFNIVPTTLEDLDTSSNELLGVTDEFRESYALEPHSPDEAFSLAATMLAIGVGLGFTNQFIDNQFLYCLHAAYYLQLAVLGQSFLYGALGLAYSGLSSDSLKQSLLEIQLRFLMFSPITQFNQVYFLYGLMLAYGMGTWENSGIKDDITAFTAAIVVGLAVILTANLTLMLQTNVLAHIRETREPDGGGNKIENNYTRGFINKNNILAIALLFNL